MSHGTGSTAGDLRIVCLQAFLNGDNHELLIARITAEFEGLRAQLMIGTWCRRKFLRLP